MKQTPPDVSTTLPHSEDTGLRTLLREFHHRFTSELPDHLPPSRLHNHKIPTGDATPVNLPAYRLSLSQLEEQNKQVKDLLLKGLIRESTSK